MKKKTKGCLVSALVALTLTAGAMQDIALDNASATYWGANRCTIIKYSDLTSTNLVLYSQTLTNTNVKSKGALIPVCAVVVTPFTPSGTNLHNSLTFTVGTTGATNSLQAAQQVNGNGTPVYIQMGSTTLLPTVTTNITSSWIGTTNYPLNIYTAGEVRIYYKVLSTANAK